MLRREDIGNRPVNPEFQPAMARPTPVLTGREITFAEHEIIVSKTDTRGVITYANDVFLRVAGYTEADVMGQPHNIIRHPDMPRCVFALLWDTIKANQEIFAYVLNRAKNGDHYWVFAHVTPSFDAEGRLTGYHSNRRVPYADALPKVRDLYARLRLEEQKQTEPGKAVEAGHRYLVGLLTDAKMDYAEFVFSLSTHTQLASA
jgi:PAS domain S-box-containing protein